LVIISIKYIPLFKVLISTIFVLAEYKYWPKLLYILTSLNSKPVFRFICNTSFIGFG